MKLNMKILSNCRKTVIFLWRNRYDKRRKVKENR